MEAKKNILICPLDWGLGHATRCVPVIKELQRLGCNVIIGADKNPLAFLKQEFPELKTVVIPGYEVTYDEQGSAFKLFCESVRFYSFIKKEHGFLDAIIKENKIDVIISDNRYGLWSKKIKSIIITHQLYVKAPMGNQIAHKKIAQLIKNFDECWIPDVEGEPNLSGELSHLKPFEHPHRFIGPLSRFSFLADDQGKYPGDEKIDILAILSGPEPQRTIFEKMIIEQFQGATQKMVVLRGLPNTKEVLTTEKEGLTIFNHIGTTELAAIVQKSDLVICRSGYSSIMDLVALNKRAILVPTPGQTEQEYLAKHHLEQGNFYCLKQHEFNLNKALEVFEKYTPQLINTDQLKLDFLLR